MTVVVSQSPALIAGLGAGADAVCAKLAPLASMLATRIGTSIDVFIG
jgi:hypothetical protein